MVFVEVRIESLKTMVDWDRVVRKSGCGMNCIKGRIGWEFKVWG